MQNFMKTIKIIVSFYLPFVLLFSLLGYCNIWFWYIGLFLQFISIKPFINLILIPMLEIFPEIMEELGKEEHRKRHNESKNE